MTREMILAGVTAILFAPAAWADSHATGDAAAGEALFRQCQTCHLVENDAGEVLAGRANTRTGPNLYGVAGRVTGTYEGFNYTPSLTALGEAGHVWTEENFMAFVQDPRGYVREALGDNSANSAMSFRARSDEDARNLYAFLASLADQ